MNRPALLASLLLAATMLAAGATLTSASSGPDSSLAITLNHRRAAAIISAAGPWRPLPLLSPDTATLAPNPSGGWNALAVRGTQLTIWQAGVPFAADDLGAWLVSVLADAGRRTLTELVLGTDQERALRVGRYGRGPAHRRRAAPRR